MKVEILESLAGSDKEGIFTYQTGAVVDVSKVRYESIKGLCKLVGGVKKEKAVKNTKKIETR